MTRVKGGIATKRRHRRVLKKASGYFGGKSRLFRSAIQAVEMGMKYSTRDRRVRKRSFRSLWIARITAGLTNSNLNYSRFLEACKKANLNLNRKMLSEIAIQDPAGFQAVVQAVQKA